MGYLKKIAAGAAVTGALVVSGLGLATANAQAPSLPASNHGGFALDDWGYGPGYGSGPGPGYGWAGGPGYGYGPGYGSDGACAWIPPFVSQWIPPAACGG